MSKNSWTSDTLCSQWFEKSFIPQAQAWNKSRKKILLIFDGHGSHVTNKMIELFLLLAHTTHMCQPLNISVFGPGQKVWAQQCDLHYVKTGWVMQKEDVVSEYMKAWRKAFQKKNIISAWIKCSHCSIRPPADGVSGVNAFTLKDFTSSNNASTHAHLSNSFPTKPPSDFELWPTQDEMVVAQSEEEMSGTIQITMHEFSQMWIAEDGTGSGSDGQISKNSSSESEEDSEDDDLIEDEGRSEVELMVTNKQTVSCDPCTISRAVTFTYDAVNTPSSSHLCSAAIAPPPLPSSSTQIPCIPKSLSQTEELNELLCSSPLFSLKNQTPGTSTIAVYNDCTALSTTE